MSSDQPRFRPTRANIEEFMHPKFDRGTGERMKMIRMKMLIDQAEIGELLGGVSQQSISNLEKGRIDVAPFTLARMRAVFGKWTHYILYAAYEGMVNPKHIHLKYWEFRLNKNRKPGSGAHKKSKIGSGNSSS